MTTDRDELMKLEANIERFSKFNIPHDDPADYVALIEVEKAARAHLAALRATPAPAAHETGPGRTETDRGAEKATPAPDTGIGKPVQYTDGSDSREYEVHAPIEIARLRADIRAKDQALQERNQRIRELVAAAEKKNKRIKELEAGAPDDEAVRVALIDFDDCVNHRLEMEPETIELIRRALSHQPPASAVPGEVAEVLDAIRRVQNEGEPPFLWTYDFFVKDGKPHPRIAVLVKALRDAAPYGKGGAE